MTEETIRSLTAARHAAADCQRCPLYRNATQIVFGEGPEKAVAMFVGEQPGDQEDRQGRPFVGPAGRLFDEMLERVGIARSTIYVTNAVKHFKFEPSGKRRIHQRPNGEEVAACRFWLNLERDLIRPKVIVALGATAARSLLGRASVASPSPDCAAPPSRWRRAGCSSSPTILPICCAFPTPKAGGTRGSASKPISVWCARPWPMGKFRGHCMAALDRRSPSILVKPPSVPRRLPFWGGVAQLVRATES